MPRKLLPLPIPLLVAFVLACGGDGGGAAAPNAGATGFPLTITQSDGVRLTIEAPPQRIVSLASHATEVICALGAGDRLAAVDRFENCPAGSRAKPEVDSFQPNLEAIVGFRPDLVYVFSNQGGVVEALRRAGVPVLFLQVPATLQGVFENIALIGAVTGRAGAADALIADMRRRVDAVKARLASLERGPRFFHELDSTLYTVRNDTFIGELYVLLKGQNIAADAQTAYPQLSSETVIARDPEVIVLADEAAVDDVRGRAGWSVISAVRQGRVCRVDGALLSRPGPRIVDGLEALARCLYPDRFS
jgi:iron complex transport system substrate-binding protein